MTLLSSARVWLHSSKAKAQTRLQTVQADPCRLVCGVGGLRCWCLAGPALEGAGPNATHRHGAPLHQRCYDVIVLSQPCCDLFY